MCQPELASMQPLDVLGEGIHHLESASQPWSVHVEVHLEASLDQARLGQALGAALDRHPRARARLVSEPGWRQQYYWEIRPRADLDPVDVVDVVDGDSAAALARAREELQSRPMSLHASPPLRLRLVRRLVGDVLVLNVHHAAGDGMAAMVFLQSLARAYASRPEIVARPRPGLPHGNAGGAGSRPWAVLRELAEAARPSATIAADGGRAAPGYGFHLLSLGADRTRALTQCAGDGTTVNDLLLGALHLSVDVWNRAHGVATGRISVLMPVNLRPRAQWREEFANLTFMVPVSTGAADRLCPERVLETVRSRTRWVKEQRSPAAVVHALSHLQSLPRPIRRGIARRAASERLRPTTLLSNLGRLEHDLDFGVDVGRPAQVWFSPPARMPLGVAIGAITVGDDLGLTFRLRPPLLGPEAASRFAAVYQSSLDEVIEARSSSSGRRSALRAA